MEHENGTSGAITPKELYDCNDLNMFGNWVIFIIYLLINPLYYLYRFMYWAFHAGRRK